ncbi:MAG: hypothetical protein AB1505_30910 [Candidatus Latescibacterota bacterium]
MRLSQHECLGGLVAAAAFVVAPLPVRGYEVHHPVFPAQPSPEEVSHLRDEVAAVMRFGPEQVAAFVVARTSHYNIDCPNCDAGNPQRVGWQWSADDPEHITCGYCGMVFPSDGYPLDKVTTTTDATGLAHDYPYFEGRGGYKHYIRCTWTTARRPTWSAVQARSRGSTRARERRSTPARPP